MKGVILTCNAGSSNTKLALFDAATLEKKDSATTHNDTEMLSWLRDVSKNNVVAIGHRIVHGGQKFFEPQPVTSQLLSDLRALIPLAPLHQPAALNLIEKAQKIYPGVLQAACFDTAFHHTTSDLEKYLPLPGEYYEKGVLRYGFHGLSYQYIASVLPKHLGTKAGGRVVVAHLGSGSSMCAMRAGKSVASTMGFSTLDGLMMGTRPGSLDAGALLYMLREEKRSVSEIEKILYHESGLKGISGISGDVKELEQSKDTKAAQTLDLYAYAAAKQLGGLLMVLGGIDALVFTGGIGEHSALLRSKICHYLAWLGATLNPANNEQNAAVISQDDSRVAVYVIPTNEEIVIAEACRNVGDISK